jgi:ABC-2 type transport system permease protein
MKTVVISDLICLRSVYRTALITTVLGAMLMLAMGSPYILMPYTCVAMSFSLFYNLLTYDEQNGWQGYRLSLPLVRKQAVQGRYVVGLLIVGASIVLGVVSFLLCFGLMQTIAFFVPGSGVAEILATILAQNTLPGQALATAVGCFLVITMEAIVLPLALRSGLSKALARIPLVVMGLGIGFLIIANQTTDGTSDRGYSALATVIQSDTGILVLSAVLVLVALALYAASSVLATRFYARREL